jgi:membrane protease YdiL (CAAX protease family)
MQENEKKLKAREDRRTLYYASLFSGLVWLILGSLILYYFQDRTLFSLIADQQNWMLQIATGSLFGIALGVAAVFLIRHPAYRHILKDYAIIRQIQEFSLTPFLIFFISIIAGITEEVLFRAAIQPLLGIWITSLIFIAIHGYIRFKSANHFLFTLFTFVLSMVLGLLASMTAHAIYDVIVLFGIKKFITGR